MQWEWKRDKTTKFKCDDWSQKENKAGTGQPEKRERTLDMSTIYSNFKLSSLKYMS